MPGKEKTKTALALFKMLAAEYAVKGDAERLVRVLDVLELIWEDEEERIDFCHRLGEIEI